MLQVRIQLRNRRFNSTSILERIYMEDRASEGNVISPFGSLPIDDNHKQINVANSVLEIVGAKQKAHAQESLP